MGRKVQVGGSIFLALILLSACKKFVQVDAPATQLVTTSVFSSPATATAAQVAIYSQMASSGQSYNIAENTGILGDELTCHSTVLAQQQFYADAMTAVTTAGPWINAYNYIYQANAIIENLQGNPAINAAVGQQLIGESKFIRAFWHFYLTNLYGDVPLVTTTDYAVTGSAARTPQSLVYRQIITDLKDADGLLNGNYVDMTDTATTTERTRPTKSGAEALLARVYLYTQKYDSAKLEATQVINNNLYSLCPNLSGPTNSVFLKNSREAIWQLSTLIPATYNTTDGQSFILKAAPGTGTSNCTYISPQLLNSFEPNDQRKVHWLNIYSTYYYPYKYQSYGMSATSLSGVTEYVMVLRLAEQYLIRAEAEANLGDSTDAINDLNTVRTRAGLPNYNPAIQGALLNAILHERQVELFTEWGQRWLDLKRTGAIDAVMSVVCPTKVNPATWNSYSQLYPIPQVDRTNDPNLTQNTSY